MAVLTNPIPVSAGGTSDGSLRWAVVAFKNVTAADTYDFANLPNNAFVKVLFAMFFPSTNRAATGTASTIATNTNVSMVGAGIAGDSGYCFVLGE